MTKYALIIEGSWCERTHVHKFYNTLYEAILGARDFIDEQLGYNTEKVQRTLGQFAENDFLCVEDMFVIDEVVVD